MNEELNPGKIAQAPIEVPVEATPDVPETTTPEVNYSEMSLGELSILFEKLMSDEDRMKRAKEAEAIKSAFYKKLSKDKAEYAPEEEAAEADSEAAPNNVFEAVENGFKSLYNTFKKEKAEYNRKMDAERSDNLIRKQAVIEDLKQLLADHEDVSSVFPAFREIQARWREIGPVPATAFRDLNDTYQFYVEQFYDKVQLNRDMRDLDFKKNLEAKEAFCEEAEKLSEDENVIDAFKELQKLHEQWKEFGPVAKEYREQIWERFKAATAKINKNYQAFFEGQKEKQAENLEAKKALCEKVEEIASREEIAPNQWSTLTKEIEEIQKEWKKIGYATKKENQKVYDRFRAANDKFFERKRIYYSEYKDSMSANVDLKMAIIEKAEALKDSSEWKKTTEAFIELQKQWKEIGAVPRKKADALWKRFRAACDEFFGRKEENFKAEAAKRRSRPQNGGRPQRPVVSEKEKLIQQYNRLQQDLDTYENNIGFFAASKNSEPLIKQFQERIESVKAELANLEAKIRQIEDAAQAAEAPKE